MYYIGTNGYAEMMPISAEVVMLHITPPEVLSIKLPFDIAGDCLVANAGFREEYPSLPPAELQAFIRQTEEQHERWIQNQQSAQIFRMF